MADTTTLEKVLLGDTTAGAVEKVNKAIAGLETLQDGLEDGDLVVNKATNARYSVYDVEELNKAPEAKLQIHTKYVTNSAHATMVEALQQSIANAGKVDDVYVGGVSVVTGKVARLPPYYNKTEIDTLIGNVSSGMRYMGTVGTGGTVGSLPNVSAKNGDTYKVISSVVHNGITADVGDLFIATVTDGSVVWTLIPSGDDGDVYADGNFGTTENIIVSANGDTDGKKVKASGYTISDTINTKQEKVIPTAKAVYKAIDGRTNLVWAKDIFYVPGVGAMEVDNGDGTTTFKSAMGEATSRRIVAILNSDGRQAVADCWVDVNEGRFCLTVANEYANKVRGFGYLVLTHYFHGYDD